MSDKDCNNIFCMLKIMCMKVSKIKADSNSTAYTLQGSFFEDSDTDVLKDTKWEEMARNLIYIEDDLDIINKEIDKAME